jgi:hypothetical protein
MELPKKSCGCGFGESMIGRYIKNQNRCPRGKKAVPTNKKLYNKVKTSVKQSVNRWPSAYASGQSRFNH